MLFDSAPIPFDLDRKKKSEHFLMKQKREKVLKCATIPTTTKTTTIGHVLTFQNQQRQNNKNDKKRRSKIKQLMTKVELFGVQLV